MAATTDIQAAARSLRAGGVIAYPTEAIQGLGCLPDRPEALRRLLKIKRRHPAKGLILLAAAPAQLEPWTAPLTSAEWRTILTPSRHPTTWIVPAAPDISPLLTGGRPTIAVRITRHPLARQLCLAAGSAIVSTSANLAGQPPTRNPAALDPALTRGLDLVLRGACGSARRPSQIRLLTNPGKPVRV
ncbi:MAG TPA: Sua5/YciO/YrdC/YwlC family protein [Gammaproteobacteria bacterium]|nr:Sua5/YciO/YrdC/YwlC family protein [Gammaproteobacteria bacterium]